MKRLISLDFLRGFAIFFMFIGHIFTKIYAIQTIDPANLSPVLVLIGGPLYILGRWRAFFLLISSISGMYSMNRDYNVGLPRHRILQKNLLRGGILYLVSLLFETFFHPWGIFPRIFVTGQFRTDLLTMVFYFDTLHMIAWGILLSSLIQFFIFGIPKTHRTAWSLGIYALIGAFVVMFTPVLHEIATRVFGMPYYPIQLTPASDIGTFLQRLFWSALIGLQEPIFPFFATACLGNLLGILLSAEHPPRFLPLYGFCLSFLFIGGGILLFFLNHETFDFLGEDEPTWLYLIFTGMQLFVLLLFLQFREFSRHPRSLRVTSFTRMFLRWGRVSLTLYFLEVFDIFLRLGLGWVTGQNFAVFNQTTEFGWVVLLIFVELLGLEIIIRLWEKIRFIGTWEWVFAILSRPYRQQDPRSKDLLQISELIYAVTPINFVLSDPMHVRIHPE